MAKKMKLDPMAFGTAKLSQRDVMKNAMAKKYGSFNTPAPAPAAPTPMQQSPMQGGMAQSTPMTSDAIAKRKKTMVSNAASKLMGGLYSK